MDSVAIRTAAKTFDNASHGERGGKAVLQLIINSIGRHPVLRALIKMRLKTCNLEYFAACVNQLVDDCLKKSGYPDLEIDREVKVLGEMHHVNSKAIATEMVRSVVNWKVTEAKLQDIPGNTLCLVWLAQEPLSVRQFCRVILEELDRRHMYRYNRYFWDLLESEYTRVEALKIIREGYDAQERCFQTGIYLNSCNCEMCDSGLNLIE